MVALKVDAMAVLWERWWAENLDEHLVGWWEIQMEYSKAEKMVSR